VNILVRQAELKDLSQLIRISSQSFIEMGRMPTRFGRHAIAAFRNKSDWLLVAKHRNKIVGFLFGNDEYMQKKNPTIEWLAIHPAYQRKGIGKTLLEKYEKLCRQRGFHEIYLSTPFANKFYEKNNYNLTSIKYRMVRELLGQSIERPNIDYKMLEFEDLGFIFNLLTPHQSLNLAESWVDVYELEQDKSVILYKNGKPKTILICKTDPYDYDLLCANFMYFRTKTELYDLLLILSYLGSKKSKRWVGFTTDNVQEKRFAEKMNFKESHMPSFRMQYYFEKKLL
jgi:N-acetylglutamate synthase-like GNAT family acetyltransferase